ncbi:Protein HIR1 [Zancudomyces culisetae]|uniref:Protein HIR n=1 Tax=Zancudomyces culisetae TaxID=1213189 RepID=A0A1R1PMP4_ZANCU|nr:Protein HIR1 [Zancudomyces culisetae]|eukprot:OMH82217.1 Protein HIR1 [Zancudomyces culisetae]
MEHWRVIKRLTGHESDVVDVCWSPPDNKYLASCGLDNVVFVWDGKTFERLRKLNEHSEFVKGLSFDPAGQYLATQSDDKTLKIWRTNDWKVETTINTPFESSRYSTYFRRLKLVVPIIRLLWFDDKPWAPDGSCIVSANAVNGNTPVASVITRTGWRSELALVGHRAAIEAVKFNDQIFVADLENNKEYTTVCGIGSQDRSISVWMGIQSVPLVVVDGLFLGNIMDLSWGNLHKASGWKGLMAVCSYDGTVAILEFTKEDLKAQPVSRMEQQKVLERYHLGDKLARFNSEDARAIKKRKAWGIATLNEDTYRYDDERGESSMQGQQNTEGKELNSKNTPSGTNLELAGYTAPSTKIVVIDVDGGTENSQEPAPERISNKRAAENVEQLILEQKYHDFNKRLALEHDMQNKVESEIGMCLIDSDSAKSAGGVNNAHTSTKPAAFGGDRGSGDMLAEGKVTSVKANENTEVNQVVTRNAEGKKRVAPTFLRSLGGPSTTSSMSETTGLQSSSLSHPHSISATPNTLLQTGSVGDPGFKEKGLLSTAEAGVEAGLLKRLININQGQGTNIDGGLLIERYMRRILNMIDDQVKRKVVIPNMNVSVDINVDKKDEYANRDIGFPLPQIEKNIVRIVYNDDENTKDNTSAIEIICSNYTSSNHDSSNSSQEQDFHTIEKGGDRTETNDDSPPKHSFIAKVSAYQSSKNDEYEDKQVLWNIYSNSPITLMNTNSPKYVIFGCYDTSVNIYSIFGSR